MTNDLQAYPRVLAALKVVDRADWAFCDAILAEVRPHARGAAAAMEHLSAWLDTQGYEYPPASLGWRRRIAAMYPPNTRVWNAPLAVYSEMCHGCKEPAEAVEQMQAFMRHCANEDIKPSSNRAKEFLQKPTVRYSVGKIASLVEGASLERQDEIIDELVRRRVEADVAERGTPVKAPVHKQCVRKRSPTKVAGMTSMMVSRALTQLTQLVEDDRIDEVSVEYRRYISQKLKKELDRLGLLIEVLEGKRVRDDDLVALLEQIHDEVRAIRSPVGGIL